jgi:hypothetical protein
MSGSYEIVTENVGGGRSPTFVSYEEYIPAPGQATAVMAGSPGSIGNDAAAGAVGGAVGAGVGLAVGGPEGAIAGGVIGGALTGTLSHVDMGFVAPADPSGTGFGMVDGPSGFGMPGGATVGLGDSAGAAGIGIGGDGNGGIGAGPAGVAGAY